MAYLDPRGGHTPSGDDTNVPMPYPYDVPGDEEPDPYAQFRSVDGGPDPEPGPPATADDAPLTTWNTPTSVATPGLGDYAKAPRHSRGRRRATRSGAPAGRAGRNLPAAIAVGLGLGAAVLCSLIFWKPAFLIVIVVAAAVGIWETSRAFRTVGPRPPLIPLLAGGVLTVMLAWYEGVDSLTLGLGVTILAAVVWRLADGWSKLRRDFVASLLIAVYVPFLLGFAVILVEPDDGVWRVLATLIAVVLSDTGGYASGVFLGKHYMAPSISPKKSWEGFAGSLITAAIGSAIVFQLALHAPFYWGLVFGAGVSAAAVVGDLAESMLKRDLGIKDMSNLLPGHGGLMDRLDSILFAVPAAYLLFALLAPPT